MITHDQAADILELECRRQMAIEDGLDPATAVADCPDIGVMVDVETALYDEQGPFETELYVISK
jgi:hypothetical protein